MTTKFQETNWRGYSFPPELAYISTKNPNAFLLNSELREIEGYLKGKERELEGLEDRGSEEGREKQLEKLAGRLKYNESWMQRKGLEVLGKREEDDADSLARFYQECGIEYSNRDSEGMRRPMTPGGKVGEEWYEDKSRKKNVMRKYDPRIRGMMRLGEQMSAEADLTQISSTLLGEAYEHALQRLFEQLATGVLPENLPTEDSINGLINEVMKNKKMQERVNQFIEKTQKEETNGETFAKQKETLMQIVDQLRKAISLYNKSL